MVAKHKKLDAQLETIGPFDGWRSWRVVQVAMFLCFFISVEEELSAVKCGIAYHKILVNLMPLSFINI
jgi:hypothetical protein